MLFHTFSIRVLTNRFTFLFSYLLLYNKLCQNLAVINNENLFSQNLWGLGIFCAAGWFLLWSHSRHCNQDVSQDWSHLTTSARLQDLVHRWPMDRDSCCQRLSVPHWLFVGGLSFSLWGLVCRAAWVFSWLASLRIIRVQRRFNVFMTSPQKSHFIISVLSFWICRLALLGMWESYIHVNTNTQKSRGPTWRLPKNYSQFFIYFNVVV